MDGVKGVDQLSLILSYVVPGLVILWVRSRFLTKRFGSTKDEILSYFAVSAIYVLALDTAFRLAVGRTFSSLVSEAYWNAAIIAGAAAFGALLGLDASGDWSRKLFQRIGLRMPHPLASAWDWKFSKARECAVIVTLEDGRTIAGWLGTKSFIGSGDGDKDLYLEQIYDIDDNGDWSQRSPGKGIYIAAGETRLIEFIPGRT